MKKPIFNVMALCAALAGLGKGAAQDGPSVNKERAQLQSQLDVLLTPPVIHGRPVRHHKWNQRQAHQLRRSKAGQRRAKMFRKAR